MAAAPLVWSETSPRRTALFARAVVLARDVTVSHQATGSPLLSAMGHGVTLRARVSLQNKGQMRSQRMPKSRVNIKISSLHFFFFFSFIKCIQMKMFHC